MKALILAAGLGTRLKPLTDRIPKALVPIAGKPLLEHIILKIIDAGITDIIINIHHLGGQIIEFIEQKEQFGVNIQVSDERNCLLDTGGGIKKASQYFNNQDVLIHNVDIISNLDIAALIEQHRNCSSSGTLVVSKRNTSRYLLFKEKNLKGWYNVNTEQIKGARIEKELYSLEQLAFSGIQIFGTNLTKHIQEEEKERFSIIDFYLDYCEKEHITAYIQKDLKMLDVGKIDSLEEAERLITEI